MSPIRATRRWPAVAASVAVFALISLTAGCGSGGADGTAAGTISGGYADVLEDRYDEIFPDDRVLAIRIVMDESDWEEMQAQAAAKEYYRADMWIDGELVKDVAVRTKGGSSLMQAVRAGSIRVGLKVDFNFFNLERTYHGIKKLCYSNGFSDPTLMREFLGYEVMAAAGVPTPRACFVDLWVNDTHLGVYTQVEAVDGRFADDNFADGNGNLYKPELKAGRLDWTESDAAAQAAVRAGNVAALHTSTTPTTQSFSIGGGDLEDIIERLGDDGGWIPGRLETTKDGETSTSDGGVGDERGQAGMRVGGVDPGPVIGGLFGNDYLVSVGLKTNEERADYSRLYDLLEVINADPDEVSKDDLERILDVDEILRYLAGSVVLVHLDNYIGMGHNYYLYDNGGRFSVIPWDLNEAFGGFNSGLNEGQLLGFFIDEPTAASVDEYPLVKQLMAEPEYVDTYHVYLRELIEGPFSVKRMAARIDEIADLIRPYVANDEHVALKRFEQGLRRNLPGDGRPWSIGGTFIGLEYFVGARVASIAAQLDGEQKSSNGDGSGNGGRSGLAGAGINPGMPGLNKPAGQAPNPGPGVVRPTTTTTLTPVPAGAGRQGG